MREGWHGDDHLILFDDSEIEAACNRYAISKLLPGYRVLGLRGWDDFIVQDKTGQMYCVPTVPVLPKDLEPFSLPDSFVLEQDERFHNKIKWYVKPIVFGGDPKAGETLAWVSHEEHAQLVLWWNDLYRSIKANTTT